MKRFLWILQQTLLAALEHDVFNTAKAAAYSGMLCFFPAVLVVSSLLARAPEGSTMIAELRANFDEFLPAGSVILLNDSVTAKHMRSPQVLISAAALAVFAGL